MENRSNDPLEQLKYPIGRFARGTRAETPERRSVCITALTDLPMRLRALVERLTDAQLDTPYRPEGWTVRQLVHHIADSHSQSLHRFKLALSEQEPVIKPYKEALWAEQLDARTMPVEPSLGIIAGSHARWVVLLRSMDDQDFARGFVHPEQQRTISLAEALELYVWHGAHHSAHITALMEREGWM